MTPRVSVVVTDLDNTLFDWVDIWHRSFRAMLDSLVRVSGIAEGVLLKEFKEVFTRHGTSEYAFAIEELPSLQRLHPGEDLTSVHAEAIAAFREARSGAMHLYPTVRDTLLDLRTRGCLVVAYTESMSFYTNYRIRNLGLDGLIDFLYSPPDHDLPVGQTRENIRRYPPDHYDFEHTVHRYTPKDARKPDPSILMEILKDVAGSVDESVYIGDSLLKDIAMGQGAGVTTVWAKYGAAQDRPEYELLRQITHWSAEDVNRERQIRPGDCRPNFILERSFGQLRDHFEFVRRPLCAIDLSPSETAGQIIEMWKKTVEVQQHFNDLELRIRSFAITLLVGVLTVTGLTLKEGVTITLWSVAVPVGTFILLGGLVAWFAFYAMDRLWYHRLLYGAVRHGQYIESRLTTAFPEICLTEAIARESPLTFPRKFKIHTRLKMDLFYCTIAAVILLVAVILGLSDVSTKSAPRGDNRGSPAQVDSSAQEPVG